jgi:predicted PurR-regulated permease PerM
VSEEPNFGPLGRPFNRAHPFLFGFLGALGVLTALALATALARASQVLVLILTALFLAVGLNPAVEAMRRRGLTRGLAVGVMLVLVVGFAGALAAAIVPPVVSQTTQLISNAPDFLEELRRNSTLAQLDKDYQFISRAQESLAERVQDGKLVFSAFGGVVGVGRTVLSGAFSFLTVLVLTLYFLAALPKITSTAYRMVPVSRRERVRRLSDEILTRIGGFVGGQLVIAGLSGISTLILLTIMGVPYAVSLAMLVAVFGLIPLIGATLGAIAVVLVSLTISTTTTVIVFLFYVLYQQFENYVIAPRVMRRTVHVPALVTIVSALVGASLLGLLGGLIAIPLAAAVLLVIEQVVIPRADQS